MDQKDSISAGISSRSSVDTDKKADRSLFLGHREAQSHLGDPADFDGGKCSSSEGRTSKSVSLRIT